MIHAGLMLRGRFFIRHIRKGKILHQETFRNGITTQGLNDILGVEFNAVTQKTTWYFGLINSADFGSLSAGDTAAKITTGTPNPPTTNDWKETTGYSESVRQTWVEGSPSGGVITHSSRASFTMNTSVTVKGSFLVSSSTKGGTSGILWSTGLFSSERILVSSDILQVGYTLTASSA